MERGGWKFLRVPYLFVILSEARTCSSAANATRLNQFEIKDLSPVPAPYPACRNSDGRPVRRSILFAIGGCVENKFPMFTPSKG